MFSIASQNFHNTTPLSKRKRLGQYMTPHDIALRLASLIPLTESHSILDPACGTGELLVAALSLVPRNKTLLGWDIDPHVLSYSSNSPSIYYTVFDALSGDYPGESFDVILANPPYLTMTPTAEQKQRYASVIGGRVNMISLFFAEALKLIKPGGYLGFIIPPAMNTGAFYTALRTTILNQATIFHLELLKGFDAFDEAYTDAQILILQRNAQDTFNPQDVAQRTDKRYIFASPGGGPPLFTEDSTYLYESWKGKSSLGELGYRAATGHVIWNSCIPSFAAEEQENYVPLIYGRDIGGAGQIEWHHRHDSRRWLPRDLPNSTLLNKPAILLNRVTRTTGGHKVRAAYYDSGAFYAENHTTVILADHPKISWEELLLRINNVDPQYVSTISGTAQLSSREVQTRLPL